MAKAKRILKWQRDPEGMRLRILEAAKQEFAAHGLAGARVDRIALKAGANKRMLYYHVGKKDDLYLAVLEGAYEKIRAEERGLDLEHLDPPDAIERLIDFTWNYFIRNPVDARAGKAMGGKFLLGGLENAKPHALGVALPLQNSLCLGQISRSMMAEDRM